MNFLINTCATLGGAGLLYVAFFLYDHEERGLQNRLDDIWKKIEVLHEKARSKEAAFLQGTSIATTAFVDTLLGEKLWSVQAISVSMIFSLASYYGCTAFIQFDISPGLRAILILGSCILLILGVLPVLVEWKKAPVGPLRSAINKAPYYRVLLVIMLLLPWLWFARSAKQVDFAILCGTVLDIAFILFFRWILQKITSAPGLLDILFYVALLTMAAGIVTGPAVVFTSPPLFNRFFPLAEPFTPAIKLAYSLCLISLTNAIDVACVLLLAFVMILLLLHRLLWPFIKRPVYAANRKGLIQNTRVLATLGFGLILWAHPQNVVFTGMAHILENFRTIGEPSLPVTTDSRPKR